MRSFLEYHIDLPEVFKQQLLQWSKAYNPVIMLDSNSDILHAADKEQNDFDYLAGIGSVSETSSNCTLKDLKIFLAANLDWHLGYFSYELKNQIESLSSNNSDELTFPDLYFFQPRYLFRAVDNVLFIEYLEKFDSKAEIETLLLEIGQEALSPNKLSPIPPVKSRFSYSQYIDAVIALKKNIQHGDIYEANFCQEFFVENVGIDPLALFNQLTQISPAPFACYMKHDQRYLMSASPERFLKKTGNKIISQPIKGTSKRGKNAIEDKELKIKLQNDPKEVSENIMIVDLVRNDLSKIAEKQSVTVTDLCTIRSFAQVHQMISTIEATIKDKLDLTDCIAATFPMGSMTGAPKIRAMELIEYYEKSMRGLFSGSVGYISPSRDFDFNVVIRSILYNAAKGYLSFTTGGAITAKSDPTTEYQESLLKARSIMQTLGQELDETNTGLSIPYPLQQKDSMFIRMIEHA